MKFIGKVVATGIVEVDAEEDDATPVKGCAFEDEAEDCGMIEDLVDNDGALELKDTIPLEAIGDMFVDPAEETVVNFEEEEPDVLDPDFKDKDCVREVLS